MKIVTFTMVALACAVRTSGLAAFEGTPSPPRHLALGGAGVAMNGGLVAGLRNPAGLWGMRGPSAAVWASPRIFGIEGLDGTGCTAGIPVGDIPIALGFTSLGFHGYHEITVSLAAAAPIGGAAVAALRLSYAVLSIRGYGSAAVPTLDAGLRLDAGSGWDLGVLCSNVLAARMGAAGESLPVRLAAGCTYHPPAEGVSIYAACSRELLASLEWSVGVEYEPVSSFTLRAGCSVDPALLCAGCGILIASVRVEYALVHHEHLGQTHTIALSIGCD